tara:strand:+ start:365 stop:685 length:321 start_codon:yes stop_codon:yes gene_type:complete
MKITIPRGDLEFVMEKCLSSMRGDTDAIRSHSPAVCSDGYGISISSMLLNWQWYVNIDVVMDWLDGCDEDDTGEKIVSSMTNKEIMELFSDGHDIYGDGEFWIEVA